jgi:hypothetical protein
MDASEFLSEEDAPTELDDVEAPPFWVNCAGAAALAAT